MECSADKLIGYEVRTASKTAVIKSGNNYSLQYMRIEIDSGCLERFYDIKKKSGVNDDQMMRQQNNRKWKKVGGYFYDYFYVSFFFLLFKEAA